MLPSRNQYNSKLQTCSVLLPTTPTLEQQSKGDAEWDMMLALLQRYYRDHGNSNVPLHYGSQPKLAKWVEAQKQAYRGVCQSPHSHRSK
jgi:hypothetical protein